MSGSWRWTAAIGQLGPGWQLGLAVWVAWATPQAVQTRTHLVAKSPNEACGIGCDQLQASWPATGLPLPAEPTRTAVMSPAAFSARTRMPEPRKRLGSTLHAGEGPGVWPNLWAIARGLHLLHPYPRRPPVAQILWHLDGELLRIPWVEGSCRNAPPSDVDAS